MSVRKKPLLRLAVGCIALTGGTIALSCITTKLFVDAALNRDIPFIMRKAGRLISGKKKHDNSNEARRVAGEALRNRQTETIGIISTDGIELVGHYYPAARKANRILIAMHGWRSAWYRDFGMIADFWHEQGCSVLFAEERGQNESGGSYMGFGVLERYDCLDWVNWARSHIDTELPIYLCGISMGATSVMMSAALELPEQVHGIIADCGFTSPEGIWRHVSEKNLHIFYEPHRRLSDRLVRQRLHVGAGEISTTEALHSSQKPILLIHGSDDSFVPVSMTYENYRACASSKRLLIVLGAGHGMSYYIGKEEYEREVLSFWADYDGEAQGCNSKSDFG